MLLFNAHDEERDVHAPAAVGSARGGTLELSTADPAAEAGSARFGARTEVPVLGRSVVVLRRAG